MTKNWIPIVLAMLMVVQSLSVAADVLPGHLDHAPQELIDISGVGDSTQAVAPSPGSEHNTPSNHCHSYHCHGSHSLPAMQLPMVPTLSSNRAALPYSVDDLPSIFIAAILRPPIA